MIIVYRKSDKEILFNSEKSFVEPEGMSDENGKLAVIERIGGDFEDYGIYRLHDIEDVEQVDELIKYEGYINLTVDENEVIRYEIDYDQYNIDIQAREQKEVKIKELEEQKQLEEKSEKESMKATLRAIRELIRVDELTEDELVDMINLYEKYVVGRSYQIDDVFNYNRALFKVIQAHTSQADWLPNETPALYLALMPDNVIPEWKQPTMAEDAYNIGDKVIYEDKVYESIIDGNTWSPTAYPQGWKEVI